MPDPSRLVNVPPLGDPTLAPDGCSTLYVLEPVPKLTGKINWATEAGQLRDRLCTFVAEHGCQIEMITEQPVTPLDWRAQGMAAGTPFAQAHALGQTGPFCASHVRHLPETFFAGSGTVPGLGVPMVLFSRKLAASRVARYVRKQGR
jgi:phytoene desaturase